MKKVFVFFATFIISLSLISCTNIKEEKTKNSVKNNVNSNIEILITNDYLKQNIERIKEEQEKKKEEIWRAEHLLASSSTIFDPNQIERTNNIKLASTFINELVLNPNDIFSFNERVGQRTLERGFLPAEIYVSSNGEVTSALSPGGGICQVSTTLCMSVMQTQMEILERNVHSKEVDYATRENEAMINWGTSDFRFVNKYDFPIKIEILFEQSQEGEQIICNIFSL